MYTFALLWAFVLLPFTHHGSLQPQYLTTAKTLTFLAQFCLVFSFNQSTSTLIISAFQLGSYYEKRSFVHVLN